MALRPPRAVVRASVRLMLGRTADPSAPLEVQRGRLEGVARFVFPPRGTKVAPGTLGGVPADRVEHRTAAGTGSVLYLHGGGYVTGSRRTHRAYVGHLAKAARLPFHLLDYRLAPEHPFPAALEDALAAFRELRTQGPVAIAGDSAGGGLALAVAMSLRDAGEEPPAGLALLCPWTDLTLSGASIRGNAGRDVVLNEPWIRQQAERYAGGEDPARPEISPLFGDLAGLSPILVQAGGDDLIASDAERLAEKARAAGVDVDYRAWPGLWHDFQGQAGVLREADEAVEAVGRALRAWLAA